MSDDGLRLDRWLWCARFFKSRALATAAVRAGHVRLNGQRTKPAHDVAPGDLLWIQKGELRLDVEITAIPERRGPASEAATCYVETAESAERRSQMRREKLDYVPPPTRGRPDKRTRRLLRERQRPG